MNRRRISYVCVGLLLAACEPLTAHEDNDFESRDAASAPLASPEGQPAAPVASGNAKPACPAGPQAPLGEPCSAGELTCRYGYDPPACGGRTVICKGERWVELEHTDPQASCFARDAGLDAAPIAPGHAQEECPAGPQAPLDSPCSGAGLTCRYGYNRPGCGGRTVICKGERWVELEHTDPQASCFQRDADLDTSAPDASVDDAGELCIPDPAPGVGCEYVRTPGTATVTAVEAAPADPLVKSCRNNPVVVRFSFEPDDVRRTRCFKEPASPFQIEVAGSANPPRSCIDAAGIRVGTKLRVTRADIAHGSCNPVLFTFESALTESCARRCRL